jgi:hypothetical protein
MTRTIFIAAALALVVTLPIAPAQAQVNRTFLSRPRAATATTALTSLRPAGTLPPPMPLRPRAVRFLCSIQPTMAR